MGEKHEELAIALFQADCLLFGSFKLSSGITVNAYLDLSSTLFSHPRTLEHLCCYAAEIVRKENFYFESICGVSYAGIPFATLIADRLRVPLLVLIKELRLSPKDDRIIGRIRQKNEVLVVEEVMCSATSTLRTIKDLEDAGLVVKHVLVMVDLEQGGRENLSKMGYQLHSVFKLSELASILFRNGFVNEERMEDIRKGWNDSFAPNGDCITNTILEDRQSLSYESRATYLQSNISKRLFEIVCRKRTNLCVNLSSCDFDQILKTADQIGPHVCILGIHLNFFESYDLKRMHELKRLAQNHEFLLLDDRKLSEEGELLRSILKKTLNYVDLVTVFPIAGEESLRVISNELDKTQEKGILINASSFTQDSLSKSSLERRFINSTLTHCPSVTGFVSHQNSDIPLPYIHIMQDMKTTTSTIQDEVSNSYYSEDIITQKLAADIVMVTTTCTTNNIVNLIKRKQRISWSGYENRLHGTNNHGNS